MEVEPATTDHATMDDDAFPLFDDDDDALQAFLELVAADDAELPTIEAPDEAAVMSSDDSNSTASAEVVALAKPRRRKISGSTRMKNDVERMRATVTELEKELELLQRRQQSRQAEPPSGGESSDKPNVPRIWKSVAQRQYRARREAEVANETLRAKVAEQRKITQQILRALNRSTVKITPESARAQGEDGSSSATHIQRIEDHDASVEGAKCEQLFRQLDAMQGQAEAVRLDPVFESSETVVSHAHFDSDGSLWVLDGRTVPFDAAAVGNVVWGYYGDRTPHPTKAAPKTVTDQNVMIKGFRMTLGSAFELGSVEGLIVGRRFVTQDHMNMVWAADVASVGAGILSPMASLLSFQAYGWNIVSRADRGDKPLTCIRMKHCVNPTARNGYQNLFSGIVAGMVRKLVVQGVSEHQDTVYRHVDDALLGCRDDADAETLRYHEFQASQWNRDKVD